MTKLEKQIDELPKVELHIHLEGSIPLDALSTLIEKYDPQSKYLDPDQLKSRFTYKDFPHFINTWVWKNKFLREYEDFTFISEAFAKSLIRQNIVYAEAFYSPGDFARHGLEAQKLTEAIRAGLSPYDDQVKVHLVADLIRDFGPKKGARWLRDVGEVQELGVIGIGIGGSEQTHPPEPYEEVFEDARQLGFKTSAHAGEAAGPESIWGAIKSLKVDRIGHGARAIEDPQLLEYLAKEQIPVEMCPISNIRTGVFQTIQDHPVRQFFDRGIPISINTDDPEMFNTSLQNEFGELVNWHGFDFEEIIKLQRSAIDMAWCSESEKASLYEKLDFSVS